jgi:hypothetical protein
MSNKLQALVVTLAFSDPSGLQTLQDSPTLNHFIKEGNSTLLVLRNSSSGSSSELADKA